MFLTTPLPLYEQCERYLKTPQQGSRVFWPFPVWVRNKTITWFPRYITLFRWNDATWQTTYIVTRIFVFWYISVFVFILLWCNLNKVFWGYQQIKRIHHFQPNTGLSGYLTCSVKNLRCNATTTKIKLWKLSVFYKCKVMES